MAATPPVTRLDGEVAISIARDPALVRTVRLVAAAVARRASVQESAVEEIRLAVGEACAVMIGVDEPAEPSGDPVGITMKADGGFAVTVTGRVEGADRHVADLGIDPWALLRGLSEDVAVTEDGGVTTVRMTWAA